MFCEIPDFGRCCLCLPLRRGVLLFGYLNVLFSAFMVGFYSYWNHNDLDDSYIHHTVVSAPMVFRGVTSHVPTEVSIAVYVTELLVNFVLVYGAHEKRVICLKIFYYYAISTTVAAILLEVVEFATERYMYHSLVLEMVILTFTGLCIQLYLIFLVRSLLKKLVTDGPQTYDNQLHSIVTGEIKIDNGIYNNTTVVPNV